VRRLQPSLLALTCNVHRKPSSRPASPHSRLLPVPLQDLWESLVSFLRSLWAWVLDKVGVRRYQGLGDTEELNYFQPLGDAGDTQGGGGNRFTL
jgi:hypothetical protein